ncbi:dienelactone hydrolase family protein [Roseomonas rosulenta]|uniref:dienelactone hydrolase family protein n=1 Tax=Roseomonas rosulenta TaxID=2748667 RepID=UPI0018DF2F29|nr:dienelactone hydrolase family protein [Roseomonas rosulenta]
MFAAILGITSLAIDVAPAKGAEGLDAMGLLWLPNDAAPPVPTPLVVVLHDATGIDPRGWLYGDQLMAAGIAVLHVELLDTPFDGVESRQPFDEAEASIKRLRMVIARVAQDERFAHAPLGLLGFGASGKAATLLAADPAHGSRITALALLYPGCARLNAALIDAGTGPASSILLQHGDADPANQVAECAALTSRLSRTATVRRVQYAGAGFAWDLRPLGMDERRKLALPGRPDVRIAVTFWPDGAALSATRTASFFAATLAVPRR